MKAPRVPSIASSVMAQSAYKRMLLALAMSVVLWAAIVWAVAIP